MKLALAWIKKMLGVRSPSCRILGYEFEYDYIKSEIGKRYD